MAADNSAKTEPDVQPAPPPPPAAGRRTSRLAIAALILCLVPVTFPVGLVLAIAALVKIKGRPGLAGSGLAIVGIVGGAVLAAATAVVVGAVLYFLPRPAAEPAARPIRAVQVEFIRAAVTQNGPIGLALENFKNDVGRYPTTEEGLKILMSRPGGPQAPARFNGPYLDPGSGLEDFLGTPLRYVSPGKHSPNGYDLSSAGPDRRHGTADDIGNWRNP